MLLHQEITDGILKSFYKVYNELGFGFLEKVYEDALMIELGIIACNVHSKLRLKFIINNLR